MWANRGLLDAGRSLDGDQMHRQFAIGQGSVWRTLTHLLAAEYVWLEALLGQESAVMPGDVGGKLPGNQEGEGAFQSFDELTAAWEELDRRWSDYLAELTDDALDEIIYRVSVSSGAGKRFGTKRGDVLLHVCMHAHYTTAQLMNMLRQLGITPLPDVMLISLARQEVSG
jgi:uncharacterized damage-inducible protein DinB